MQCMGHDFGPIDTRFKPSYPSQRNGAKAVTIAIGFECREGLIVCADRELTHGQRGKTYAQKIWYGQHTSLSVVVTGAGDWKYLQPTGQEIVQLLKPCKSLADAKKVIRSEIRRLFKEEISIDPNLYTNPPGVDFIIAL